MAESGKPISLLMIDIDHFTRVNDTHGQAVGEKVLCLVAGHIAANVGGFDLASRYGGGEFVVVLPAAGIDAAGEVAERLGRTIAGQPLAIEDPAASVPVTVSIGVAAMGEGKDDPQKLLKIAADALCQAKEGGQPGGSVPYLILASLKSTCLRTTGSYLRNFSFSVAVRGFFLVT